MNLEDFKIQAQLKLTELSDKIGELQVQLQGEAEENQVELKEKYNEQLLKLQEKNPS